MTQELINAFEELKKYTFIVCRTERKKPLIIKFYNYNFYHLVGFHKVNLDRFFPQNIKSKDKRYKYIKKYPQKFDNIIENQFREKDTVYLRIKTFPNIVDLLKGEKTTLYDLKVKNPYSKFDGDYGLVKIYESNICCLLGLKEEEINEFVISCAPVSWMANRRGNLLIDGKRPIFMKAITAVPNNISIPS